MVRFRRIAWGALVALAACSDSSPGAADGSPGGADAANPGLPPTEPAALVATLDDLAAFGEKRVGTPSGHEAGDYVLGRMQDLGLTDVHFESFQVPLWQVDASTLTLEIDGVEVAPAFEHDVFYASGAGVADAELVWVDTARPVELEGVDLVDKIALVRRSRSYHRSSQARNVRVAGAAGMLYVSATVDNMRQVGTASLAWESDVEIPTMTIGADDGERLRAALESGSAVHAVMDVQTSVEPAIGRNVVGRIPGRRAEQIVIGAHYDTWFTGSADNGSGIAGLLGLADRMARSPQPEYTLVFVAYDGEEVALYGGYDYLRDHHVIAPDPILVVINFEMPSAIESEILGLARSRQPILEMALRGAGLNFLYPFFVELDVVPGVFGGVIPTDIQGMYRAGVPTISTAADSPYYHTVADTPDKVDAPLLAQSVDAFHAVLDFLGAASVDDFAVIDDSLWHANVSTSRDTGTGDVIIDVAVTDAAGAAQPGAAVEVALLYDDFFEGGIERTIAGDDGRATVTITADAAALGSGERFLHVTAGEDYPLVETVIALDE